MDLLPARERRLDVVTRVRRRMERCLEISMVVKHRMKSSRVTEVLRTSMYKVEPLGQLLLMQTSIRFSVDMSPINLDRIQAWIDAGRLNPNLPITIKELQESRCVHGIKDGVKLLGRASSTLTTPINIVVSRASAAAIEAVEKAGGTVTTRYYTKPAITRILKGQTHPIYSLQSKPVTSVTEAVEEELKNYKYRLPDPASRKDIEYYRDPAHRGYLSYLLEEGQGPSLFFKTPGTGRVDHKKKTSKGGKSMGKGENRVW